LGPSLARTPGPTYGQRPRRSPRLRPRRCHRCNRLNCPRCCQRHCHRPSPRCIPPLRLRLRLHRNRRPCRGSTELFSYTCFDPAAEHRPQSKAHARPLAGAYFAAIARSNRSADAGAVARADALRCPPANSSTSSSSTLVPTFQFTPRPTLRSPQCRHRASRPFCLSTCPRRSRRLRRRDLPWGRP
jgi:hypothetical protein